MKNISEFVILKSLLFCFVGSGTAVRDSKTVVFVGSGTAVSLMLELLTSAVIYLKLCS